MSLRFVTDCMIKQRESMLRTIDGLCQRELLQWGDNFMVMYPCINCMKYFKQEHQLN